MRIMTLRRPFCSPESEMKNLVRKTIRKAVRRAEKDISMNAADLKRKIQLEDRAVYESVIRTYRGIENQSERERRILRTCHAYKRMKEYEVTKPKKRRALEGVMQRAIEYTLDMKMVLDDQDEGVRNFIDEMYECSEDRRRLYEEYETRRDKGLAEKWGYNPKNRDGETPREFVERIMKDLNKE